MACRAPMPATRPSRSTCSSSGRYRSCPSRPVMVSMSPTTTSSCLAREIATLSRWAFFKNPIRSASLLRTRLRMTTSASSPSKASTVSTARPGSATMRSSRRSCVTWSWYMAMTATRNCSSPSRCRWRTTRPTASISARFEMLPDPPFFSRPRIVSQVRLRLKGHGRGERRAAISGELRSRPS